MYRQNVIRIVKRFGFEYKIIRRIKKNYLREIPYPEYMRKAINKEIMARKRYTFIHFSHRKKQKPLYRSLKMFYYRVLKLRRDQSTPVKMKEKIKKHYLKKIGYTVVCIVFILEEIRLHTKKFIKKTYKVIMVIHALQKFFTKYYAFLKRQLWLDAFTLTLNTAKYKKQKRVFSELNGNYKSYEVVRILRFKPETVIYSKKLIGKRFWRKRHVASLSYINILKINLKLITKFIWKTLKRKVRAFCKWSFKKIKHKRLRRRFFLKLNNSWGNPGKFHYLRCKGEKVFLKKDMLMYTGKKYFSRKKFNIYKNKLKYDFNVFFPLPNVKKNKRTKLNFTYIEWLNAGYIILEKAKFLDLKLTKYCASSNNSNIFIKSKYFGHPFHLVSPSVLPLTFSFVLFVVIQDILGFIWLEFWYSNLIVALGHVSMVGFFFSILSSWILEIYSEEQSGSHTIEVQRGFRYAILLFILSELMLFVSFFWAYFHFSLNSNSFTGGSYTPIGLVPFYWFRIPLLNTLLLLASGLSLTISHIILIESDKLFKLFLWLNVLGHLRSLNWFGSLHLNIFRKITFKKKKYLVSYKWFAKKLQYLASRFGISKKRSIFIKNNGGRSYNHIQRVGRLSNDFQINIPKSFIIKFRALPKETTWQANFWLLDTVIKGFVFLIYQAYEYTSCMFSINDGVYGAVFFSLTGLHGLHVYIGVMFLFFGLFINLKKHYGKFFRSFRTWRRYLYVYLDRGALPRNAYSGRLWTNRVAFDGSAWYWHFVDVVWFFVFVFVYWWGFSLV